MCARLLVVKQKDALVWDANTSYFFEWKKVISFFVDETRSLMSETLALFKFSLLSTSDNFDRRAKL